MQYKTLGHTDIKISLICLGTMTFGEQNTEQESHQQLDYALDQGVNFIDVAEMYPVPPREETQGLTEKYVGTWLAKHKQRDQVVLASKVAGPGMMPYLRDGSDLNADHIRRAVDDSLKRLQTDYIDLYQIHWPSRGTNFFGQLGYQQSSHSGVPIMETLSTLADLVSSGKVRHIGISNETPWGLAEYLKLAERHQLPRIVSIQNPYGLLNRSFEVGLAEMAEREQVGLLAYSPLGFGMLSGKYENGARPKGARLSLFDRFDRYSNSQAEQACDAYVKLARAHGLSPAQMALAYVNSRSFVSSNIIGATTLQQLKENIASIEVSLSETVCAEIEAIQQRIPNPSP